MLSSYEPRAGPDTVQWKGSRGERGREGATYTRGTFEEEGERGAERELRKPRREDL